jgi:hypothetical protein
MKKVFGCASANINYVNGYGPPVPPKPFGSTRSPEEYSAAELNQIVTASMYGSTYGNWLGVTGPGALFREIIKNEDV